MQPDKRGRIAKAIATSLGAGQLSWAPGTVGALVAIPAGFAIQQVPAWALALLMLALFGLGVWACGETARRLGNDDPSCVVFDETWGMLAVLAALPWQPIWIIAGFVLFRFFDIAKPGLIGWLDRRLSGGVGIMTDDAAAALAAVLTAVPIIGAIERFF
jgi:phosphatidylglycerophosphatase A